MPKPKLGSTHDAGISPRKEAARGRGVSRPPPRVCTRGRQTISFLLSLRGQVPVTGRGDTVASPLSRGCLPPGQQWGRAETSLGTREAHPRPHLLLQLGRRARAPGQRLCFPDSNYVCGSAASAGDAAPLPCTPRMTGGARAAGGGSGAQGGAHPAAGARRRLGSPGGTSPLTWRRSAAWGAGSPVPGVRGGGSERRGGGGGRARAQHVGRAARSCPGAAEAGGLAGGHGGWMRAGWGERPRWPGAAAARPSVRSSSRSGPGPGLAAAAAFARDRLDPFQG